MIPTVELKGKGPWRLWAFGDVHAGASAFDAGLFQAHIERAREERWRAVCLGDITEMVTVASRVTRYGALYEQEWGPAQQIEYAKTTLSEIPYLDAVIEGNHDMRAGAEDGRSIWEESIIPHVRAHRRSSKPHYLGYGGEIIYRSKDHEWRLALSHGEGPVVNPYTTLFRMMLTWRKAGVYLAGHTHHLFATSWSPVGEDLGVVVARTGTYLRFSAYQARRLWAAPPVTTGSLLFTLERDGGISHETLTT